MTRPSKEERIKYNVDYPQDSDYSSFARLLQSKWRENKLKLPFSNYGNFLPADIARETKANFLTDKIRTLVQYELYRKGIFKKLIKEDRMWENLLSSQPLCFNLFGELHFDHKLATKYFSKLFPERIDIVTEILFEHSPGRRNKKYTGDRSAFDVFIEYSRGDLKGFIGIEVKYTESLKEESADTANKNFKEHYETLTNQCGIFISDSTNILKHPPLSQIWRDHLLSIATKQDYDEGFFVFLFPAKNKNCQVGVDNYKNFLAFDNEEQNGFYPRHLEDFINTLSEIDTADWIKELKERYIGN
jgi:hypothetical protein